MTKRKYSALSAVLGLGFCLGVPAAPGFAVDPMMPVMRAESATVAGATAYLRQGGRLGSRQAIKVGQYTLSMQADGNAVMRGNGRVLWSTGTTTRAVGGYVTVRSEGAFAVRNRAGRSVWATRPAGAGAYVVIQTNGDLVLRNPRTTVWRSNRPGADVMTAGATLRPGQFVQARLNGARLTMQPDGHLVQSSSRGGVVWSATCAAGSSFSLRGDGGVAVTTPSGQVCWSQPALAGAGPRLTMGSVNNLTEATSTSARLVTPPAAYAAHLGADQARTIFDQLNVDRYYRGRPLLRWNARLASAAHGHNLAMAAANTLSHQLPGEPHFSARFTAAGYPWSHIAENCGYSSDTAYTGSLGIHRSMLAEVAPNDGHRRNILSTDVVDVGIDVHVTNGRAWVTQDFGRPA